MMDKPYTRAEIPSISLFYIADRIHGLIDGYIYSIEATSSTKSIPPDEPKRDFSATPWIKYKTHVIPTLSIAYSRATGVQEEFNLQKTVEVARQLKIGEIWIDKLVLHIFDPKMHGNILYVFKNSPLTIGSKAAEKVHNQLNSYYEQQKLQGWIGKIPHRHLPMVEAKTFENLRVHLTIDSVISDEFITWMSQKVPGLIWGNVVVRTAEAKIVDIDLTPPKQRKEEVTAT